MKAKKFGAVAMALAMAGTMVPMSAFAEEEETQDFNGAEVRVFGNKWNELDPDAEGDKTQYLDAAAQIEEKYNIKFVYSRPDGYDGYNLGELIQAGITAGDAGVDILDSEPDALISLISSGALTDLTDDMDQIHVGSLYKQAVTWQDHCYGMTFDNVGDTYFMVYSRDYLEDIGMDVTPTEKFMAGEWSYDDMKEYLTEMKAKLPDGVYPIGIHYYHWASMAAAANGIMQIDSDGNINFNEEGFIEAMSFYRELIDEVGVDKFRERFEELQKTAMEFIEMAGFSETAYCNERILMQVILDYFMDVMRLKEFHSIERIRTEKLFAYTISWIVRRKPIQFRDYSEEERDIFINERFAAYLLINECLMCGTKHFVQEAYAEKLVEYTEMLLYYFKYRQCDPKTLELLIESFKMGGLVH
mgnify:CR=1 FL=1